MSETITDEDLRRFYEMVSAKVEETNPEIAKRDIAIIRLVAEVRRLRAAIR